MTTITKEWLQQTIAEFENTRDDIPFGLDDDDAKILIVLKRALASLERERIRREHAEWSDSTFGNVGPVGPLKHLSKEALEAAADPSDPLEWADMQFLLWDAQRRMGISDEFITRAMIEKLAINKQREWPEPKDGEPRLHMKESDNSPVTPDGLCPCCGRKPLKHIKCSVPGCVRKHVAHGLCQRHYDMKRREDPEQVEKFREANRRFTAKKRAQKAAVQKQEVK
ncbi:DUF550 domain-containing protein [Salmonella enterica]